MITAMGGQNTQPAGAAAGELDRRFHRLGTAIRENNVTKSRRSYGEQSLRELACRYGNRWHNQIRLRLPPHGLHGLPYGFGIVAKRNGAKIRAKVGVAGSFGIEQIASFAADEFLVESEPLREKALVRRDISRVGLLVLLAAI